jgi:hypothetical protein
MDKAAKLERIKSIRADALLAIKEKRSTWTGVGSDRWTVVTFGDVTISYRTPFEPRPPAPKWRRYMKALIGGKDYGLNIWLARKKVLNVEWSSAGALEIISYKAWRMGSPRPGTGNSP